MRCDRVSGVPILSLLAAALLALFPAPVHSQQARPPALPKDLLPLEKYIRIVPRPVDGHPLPDWAIEASIRTLVHPRTGRRIELYSMQHFGEPSFYEALETGLNAANLVLEEAINIRSGDKEPSPDDDFPLLYRYLKATQQILGLALQGEWERDFRKSHWQVLDLPYEKLQETLEASKTSLVTDALKERILSYEAALKKPETSEARAAARRSVHNSVLREIIQHGFGKRGHFEVIQAPRDAAIFEGLKKTLANGDARTIALIYGAAHTHRLEPRITKELGFRFEAVSWNEVMVLRLKPQDAMDFLIRGKLFELRQDWKAALADYSRGLEAEPEHLELLQNRGYIRYQTGDRPGAVADFKKAIALDEGDDARMHTLLGVSLAELGNPKEALPHLERALELDPQSADALNGRGFIAHEAGDSKTALEYFEKALALSPSNVRYLANVMKIRFQTRDYDGTVEAATRLVNVSPRNAEGYFYRGTSFGLKGKPEALLADYRTALKLNPDYREVYWNRAKLFTALKRYPEALPDLDRTLEFAPRFAPAYELRGNVQIQRGKPDLALKDFDQAIQHGAKSVNLFFQRGTLRMELKREYQQAIEDLTQADRLAPGNHHILGNRAYARLRLKEYDGAFKDYSAAIKVNPKRASLYRSRAFIRAQRAEWKEAIPDYTKALDLEPGHEGARRDRANAYRRVGDFAAAEADYTKLLKRKPPMLRDWINRGVCRYFQGNLEGAMADQLTARKQYPKAGRAHANLALIFAEIDRTKDAFEFAQKGLTLNPKRAHYAHAALGLAYLKTGKTDEARKAFEEFEKAAEPEDPLRPKVETWKKGLEEKEEP